MVIAGSGTIQGGNTNPGGSAGLLRTAVLFTSGPVFMRSGKGSCSLSRSREGIHPVSFDPPTLPHSRDRFGRMS